VICTQTEQGRTASAFVSIRVPARGLDRATIERGNTDGYIVDDAADDSVGDIITKTNRIGGDFRHFSGELILAR
jgi:hypothetical protein